MSSGKSSGHVGPWKAPSLAGKHEGSEPQHSRTNTGVETPWRSTRAQNPTSPNASTYTPARAWRAPSSVSGGPGTHPSSTGSSWRGNSSSNLSSLWKPHSDTRGGRNTTGSSWSWGGAKSRQSDSPEIEVSRSWRPSGHSQTTHQSSAGNITGQGTSSRMW